MTKGLFHTLTCLASAGLIVSSMGCHTTVSNVSEYRTFVVCPAQVVTVPTHIPRRGMVIMAQQPDSQTVLIGSSARFSVLATKAPQFTTKGVSYQWQVNPVQLNGELYWTNIPGATNSTLVIENAQTNDVGYYRAIAQAGGATKVSEPAPLVLCVRGSLTVIGTPVVGNGTAPQCCNSYIGYVKYGGCAGFSVINPSTPATVADLNRADTIIEGVGAYGDGPPQLPCQNRTWIVDAPIPSPAYWFTLYFPGPSPPNPPVPMGIYALTLGNNFR